MKESNYTCIENAVDDLEKAYYFYNSFLNGKIIDLKWTVLAIHGSIYRFVINYLERFGDAHKGNESFKSVDHALGFIAESDMNLYLQNWDDTQMLTEKKRRRAAYAYLESKSFDKCVGDICIKRNLGMTEEEKQNLKVLNLIRNDIVHSSCGFTFQTTTSSLKEILETAVKMLRLVIGLYPIDYESNEMLNSTDCIKICDEINQMICRHQLI